MAQPLKVLFIGETGVEAIIAELQRGGYTASLHRVVDRRELDLALAGDPDIAISDFTTGADFGALPALRVILAKSLDLPLIVVSGKIRDSDVIAVLKAGAADHLTRGNLMRLNAAVERELRGVRMRRDRSRLEEQFRQTQKMEAVGRLAGGVAHDFNNLLTVITGYSDLLLAGRDLKESQRTAVEEIRHSSERGAALTRQLLACSRRQPMKSQLLPVNELVMQMEGMLRRLVGENIELATLVKASCDCVMADPGRLEQVIMSLVINSKDAMPHGGKLTIETGSVQLYGSVTALQLGVVPGHFVTISVTDTGIGMDHETQSHLFEPFFTTKSPGRGTGLGLATAYGIIRQSGGAIDFQSEPGQGTTARIYLPESHAVPEPAAGVQPDGPPPTGGETILIVEDETSVRAMIVDVLTGRGYRVLEAGRGAEALQLCKAAADKIDLAIVEVVMPEMSGPDLVRRIAPIYPNAHILYIAGYADEAILRRDVTESGAAFLQKPFVPEQLARMVREVLDGRARGARPV